MGYKFKLGSRGGLYWKSHSTKNFNHGIFKSYGTFFKRALKTNCNGIGKVLKSPDRPQNEKKNENKYFKSYNGLKNLKKKQNHIIYMI